MHRTLLRRPWRFTLAAALATLATLAVLAGCSTLDEQQRKWVFQPSKVSWWGGTASADGMQDAWIEFRSAESDADVRLHGLWLPQANAAAPVVLYLHGARWDVRSSSFRMRNLHELGFAVLGIDYRGFGQSTDTLPSETLAYEDARAAWDWLVARHPASQAYIFGQSLGAAIAVQLASEVDNENGVMVEGSFPSLAAV
ncbi:MAG: alpha/beta fold hydrolase, partial [Rubrivivax sp.]